jgi:hypothetical protein
MGSQLACISGPAGAASFGQLEGSTSKPGQRQPRDSIIFGLLQTIAAISGNHMQQHDSAFSSELAFLEAF